MGHDVDASLIATLAVNASRGARRSGADLSERAHQIHEALLEHGQRTFATGQLLRTALDGSHTQIVNAGHPAPSASASVTTPSKNSAWRSTCP